MLRFRQFLEDEEYRLSFDQPPVPVPEWLYHVTPFASDIISTGFKPRTVHKLSGILGGAGDDAVSFTTLDNATAYAKGLKKAWQAVNGSLDIDDPDAMTNFGRQFGFNDKKMNDLIAWVNNYMPGASKEKKILSLMQQMAIPGFTPSERARYPRFPMIMGGSFPERLKDSEGITILAIKKGGVKKVEYNRGEDEWRVYDPENLDYNSLKTIQLPYDPFYL